MIKFYKNLRGSGISWWGSALLIVASPFLYIYGKLSEKR